MSVRVLAPAALFFVAFAPEAFAADAPDNRRAIRAEACRTAAEKQVPPRLVDRAVGDRQRAAYIAECIAEAERRGGTSQSRN
jgi:hypothetical protein